MRHADAHIHGNSEIFLSLEDTALTIDISAPRANFARADGSLLTEDDVSDALAEDLVSLPDAARCSIASLHLDQTGDGSHHHDDHPHESDDDGGGHSDYLLTLSYSCDAPDALRELDFVLFSNFTGFETAKVIFMSGPDMVATTLNPEKTKVAHP